MARTIESPGVEIREIDLSNTTTLPIGTNILVQGFAAQGPTDELVNITSISEFENIYGSPAAPAERYFYESCKQVLNSPGRLIVNRLPYGDGTGFGTSPTRSALFYPVVPVVSAYGFNTAVTQSVSSQTLSGATNIFTVTYEPVVDTTVTVNSGTDIIAVSAVVGNIIYTTTPIASSASYDITINYTRAASTSVSAIYDDGEISLVPGASGATIVKGFVFGAPILIPNLSADQIVSIMNGEYFADSTVWNAVSTEALSQATLRDDSTNTANLWNLGKAAGMIVLNSNSTNIENNFTGYYVGVNDNYNINDNTYDKFKYLYTRTGDGLYTKLQSTGKTVTLATGLSGTISSDKGSVSEIVEISPGFSASYASVSGISYQHCLEMSLWKVYESVDETQGNNVVLRTYYNVAPFVGSFVKGFTDTLNSRNAPSMFVEDVPDQTGANTWMDVYVSPMIKNIMTTNMFVRVNSNNLASDPVFINSNKDSNTRNYINGKVSTYLHSKATDGLFAIGPYAPTQDVNAKKIGNLVHKLERGLGLAENMDLIPLDIVLDAGLSTINAVTRNVKQVKETGFYNDEVFFTGIKDGVGMEDWLTVFNTLNTFCGETRKDCMCIVDPLRHIFVQNASSKVADNKTYSFSIDILAPLRTLVNSCNSSYAAVYANWVKSFDSASGSFFWAPFSGYQAAIMARVDALLQPWFAPAGLNNGIIRNIVDIAISPNQRERDLLYRNGLNPITSFPRDGFVVFGQKTMQAKPSAFDRINVRRLFLFLEKATRQIAKYFVFEPNTVFTRTRLVNVLTPIFELAKRNQGVYDYLIVCDERNNLPDSIDRNELIVDIYIKPVRTAEFILINFIATRTGANFEEIIGGTGA